VLQHGDHSRLASDREILLTGSDDATASFPITAGSCAGRRRHGWPQAAAGLGLHAAEDARTIEQRERHTPGDRHGVVNPARPAQFDARMCGHIPDHLLRPG
jgi:hypothetical protein